MGGVKDPTGAKAAGDEVSLPKRSSSGGEGDEPSWTAPTGPPPYRARVRAGKRPVLLVLTGSAGGRVLLVESPKVTIGRSKRATITLDDNGVSRMHCGLACDGTTSILTDLGSTHGTVVNGERADRVELRPGDRIQLGPEVLLEFDVYDDANGGAAAKLYEGATRDLLTRALNPRTFFERLAAEAAFAVRHRTKLVAVAIEIDNLQAISRVHGPAAADAVLRGIAGAISSTLRGEDILARTRADGFVVLCRGLSLSKGVQLAERLRALVEKHDVVFASQSFRVTVSAGVAELRELGDHLERAALLELAERRLALATGDGRNRVVSKG
jgi:diguanylate cyclase (GGDEF)-like protein